MPKINIKALMLASIQEEIEEKRIAFNELGRDGQYTQQQKEFAFELIQESGIRAAARILNVPRRTLQRWCRNQGVYVRRCPGWVYEWAERRKRRKEFWQRRGYY